jgi:hypothetical protein
MKKFLLLSLLGLGMLMPTTTISAKEITKSAVAIKKVIDVGIEGSALIAHSGTEDGPIMNMVVKTVPGGKLMGQSSCGGYYCSMDISGLPCGNYVAQLYFADGKIYTWQFKKN